MAQQTLLEDIKIINRLVSNNRITYNIAELITCPHCGDHTHLHYPDTECFCDIDETHECQLFFCTNCKNYIVELGFNKKVVDEQNLKIKKYPSGKWYIIPRFPDTESSSNIDTPDDNKYYFAGGLASRKLIKRADIGFYWKYHYQNGKRMMKFYPNLWRKIDFLLTIGRYRFYQRYKHAIQYIIKRGAKVDEWQYFFYLFYQLPVDVQDIIINHFRLPTMVPCGDLFIDTEKLRVSFSDPNVCGCKPPYHEIWCNTDKYKPFSSSFEMHETDKETKLFYNGKYYDYDINEGYLKMIDKYGCVDK